VEITRSEDVPAARERARRVLAEAFGRRPVVVESLRPQDGDYARVFLDDAVEAMRAAYQALWASSFAVRVRPAQIELHVAAATVDELRAGSGAPPAVPGGYREASAFFRPGPVWVCWELREPGAAFGMSFDGLVELDDRWAWFPKPWRHVPGRRPRAVSHWTE
jgi:hypothetical protein